MLLSLAALASAGAVSQAARAAIEYTGETHAVVMTSSTTFRATFPRTISSAGTDRYLVVAVALVDRSMSVSRVTYSGRAMTRIGFQVAPTACRIELYGLVDPAADDTSHDVIVTLSAGNVPVAYATLSFTGVDQGSPTAAYVSRADTAGQPFLSIPHEEGQRVVVHECHLDARRVMQAHYAVTRLPTWSFGGAAGDWAIGGVPLVAAIGNGPADGGAGEDAAQPAPIGNLVPTDASVPGELDDAAEGPHERDAASDRQRDIDFQVGCACRTGAAARPDGPGLIVALLWSAIWWMTRAAAWRVRAQPRPRRPAGSRTR